jgi:hypothetical protein
MSSPQKTTRTQRAGNAVDERRLSGAVGADQTETLALANIDTDIVERNEAAEASGNGAHLEQGRVGHIRRRHVLPPARKR